MIHTYAIGLRARFRGLDTRDGQLLTGPAGVGEFSPFWDYDDAESRPWLRAALEAAEIGWPAPVRDHVPVNVTIPAVGPARAEELVAASGGCTTAKVKVAEPGQTLSEELGRVAAVRGALGRHGKIRVDANGGWDTASAITHLRALDRAAGGLEYAEQPTMAVADLARVRRAVGVPIAADESIRRASDPLEVARQKAADIMVVKVQPLGGVRAALEIIEEVGLPVTVSSALESSVGIAAGLALAAALPELPYACGLATINLFTSDTVTTPLVPINGALDATRARALTLRPDLAATAADPELTRRWDARRERVHELLGTEPLGTEGPR